jgi:hypothetical protein
MFLSVKITDFQYLYMLQWYIQVILRKAKHTICHMQALLVNLLQEATILKNYQIKSCISLNDLSSHKIFRPYTKCRQCHLGGSLFKSVKLCHVGLVNDRKWKRIWRCSQQYDVTIFIIISQLISKCSCVYHNYGTTNGHKCKVLQQLSEEWNVSYQTSELKTIKLSTRVHISILSQQHFCFFW